MGERPPKPLQIIEVQRSPRRSKKYRVFLNNGNFIDFGSRESQTYLDHFDPVKRKHYIARHYANIREKENIDNLTPSPSLFSMFLLWGQFDTLKQNIDYLNELWRNK
jgi:hypothetical protein